MARKPHLDQLVINRREKMLKAERASGFWNDDEYKDLFWTFAPHGWSRRAGAYLIKTLLSIPGALVVVHRYDRNTALVPEYRIRVQEWEALDAAARMGGEDAVMQVLDGWYAETELKNLCDMRAK